jgi:hypothetical protein
MEGRKKPEKNKILKAGKNGKKDKTRKKEKQG